MEQAPSNLRVRGSILRLIPRGSADTGPAAVQTKMSPRDEYSIDYYYYLLICNVSVSSWLPPSEQHHSTSVLETEGYV